MRRALEQKLKREAKERFPDDKEKQNAYVYGTLQARVMAKARATAKANKAKAKAKATGKKKK